MARRRRPLTRNHLLNRYATAAGSTYGEAHDRHAETNLRALRDIVEELEAERRPPYAAQRAALHANPAYTDTLHTTQAKGQTR